jgi:hypothetical protein
MPKEIETPPGVTEFFSHLYPQVDVERIRFYEGLPFYTSPGGAITIGNKIYFREGRFAPCSPAGVALIAHELFHVLQGSDGPGFWFIRWFYVKYVALGIVTLVRSGFSLARARKTHPLEVPASELQERFRDCCKRVSQSTGQTGPFVCVGGVPTGVSHAFVAALQAECSDLFPISG